MSNFDNSVKQFWDLNKEVKIVDYKQKVKIWDQMIRIASVIINKKEVDSSDKWYLFYEKWSRAMIITDEKTGYKNLKFANDGDEIVKFVDVEKVLKEINGRG